MKSKVQVTRDGDKILARFAYDENDIASIKAATGARWGREDKTWRCALTMENARALRAVFGDRLEILPALREWAWEQRKTEAAIEDIRDMNIPADSLLALQDRAPELAKAVSGRPYQAAGAAFAITGKRVLIGDQPGLGKTYMALAAIAESGARRILVVAPRTATRSVWAAKIYELLPGYASAYLAQGTRKERQDKIQRWNNNSLRPGVITAHILIINKEMLQVKEDGTAVYPELFSWDYDFIVMDEAHHALASRYNVQSKYITQMRRGAVRLRLAAGGYRLAMSGTPFRSKPERAWGILNWLEPHKFSSFWRWASTHFEITQTEYAREVSRSPKNPVAFRNSLRPYMLARTKAEVAPELPPITYAGSAPDGTANGPAGIWLDMDTRQAKAYQQMAALASAEINGGKINANGILAEITRLKQFACSYAETGSSRSEVIPALPSNKFEWLTGFLAERDGFSGKVIVASQFTKLLRMFQRELVKAGYEPLILTGDSSDLQRQIFQQRIQDPSDPAWIGLINTMAGGEAITLDQADDMILLDLPWTDDAIRQVEDRIHRVSRIHNVTVYRLQSRGTIEEAIARLTEEQRQELMALRPAGRKILKGIL